MSAFKSILALIAVVFVVGLGIVPAVKTTPDHATVFVDPAKRVYLCPNCATNMDGLEIVTIGEIRKKGYTPDPVCRDDGDFTQEGRSLTGYVLEKIGLLEPQQDRWNLDGSWNW